MDQHVMLVVQMAASVLSGVIVFAALILLLFKSQSPWLLLALIGSGISLLFRIVFSVAPGLMGIIPSMSLIWPITGLMVAAGLLGYALDESKRSN